MFNHSNPMLPFDRLDLRRRIPLDGFGPEKVVRNLVSKVAGVKANRRQIGPVPGASIRVDHRRLRRGLLVSTSTASSACLSGARRAARVALVALERSRPACSADRRSALGDELVVPAARAHLGRRGRGRTSAAPTEARRCRCRAPRRRSGRARASLRCRLEQRGAHRRMRRHRRGALRHLGRADRRRDVLAGEEDAAVLVEADVERARRCGRARRASEKAIPLRATPTARPRDRSRRCRAGRSRAAAPARAPPSTCRRRRGRRWR